MQVSRQQAFDAYATLVREANLPAKSPANLDEALGKVSSACAQQVKAVRDYVAQTNVDYFSKGFVESGFGYAQQNPSARNELWAAGTRAPMEITT